MRWIGSKSPGWVSSAALSHPYDVAMRTKALMRVLMVLTVATASACSGSSGPPKSAHDAASEGGCQSIKSTSIPRGWSDMSEAVTCEEQGVKFTVVWRKGGQGAEICDEHTDRCRAPMAAFLKAQERRLAHQSHP